MAHRCDTTAAGPSVTPSQRSDEILIDRSSEGLTTATLTPASWVSTETAIGSMNPGITHGLHESNCEAQLPSSTAESASTVSSQLYQRDSSESADEEVPSEDSPAFTTAPGHGTNKLRTRLKPRLLKRLNWWWWWEIGSLTISAVSTITLIGVLAAYQGQALSSWPLPIQPNAVISILTTIIKTTILLSVSACFGQLKWYHFSTPRQLHDLEAFDQASRGPWGSFLILLQGHRWTFLTVGLAVTTLASLLVEPIAQQILDFPLQETVLKEVGAKIIVSHDFKYGDEDSFLARMTHRAILGFRSTVINAVTGNISPFSFDCPEPAAKCKYPSFTTLGVCSLFRNTTEVSTQNCTHNQTTGVNSCTISWSTIWGDQDETSLLMRLNYTNGDTMDGYAVDQEQGDQRPWVDIFQFVNIRANLVSSRGPYIHQRGARLPQNYFETLDAQPKFEGFESLWYWCAQTYAASEGSAEGVSPELISTNVLTSTPSDCWSPTGPEEPEYCAYSDNSTNNTYRLDNKNLGFLVESISRTLASSCTVTDLGDQRSYSQIGGVQDFCFFLYTTPDLEAVFRTAATQVSNLIRVNGGGNINTTAVVGLAFGTEPYINVRWEWVSVPVLETILALILLATTIVVTKRSRQPLLKSSVNSLLFHGLEGWTAAETARRIHGKEILDALEGISKDLEVLFQEDEHEGLRFVRTQ